MKPVRSRKAAAVAAGSVVVAAVAGAVATAAAAVAADTGAAIAAVVVSITATTIAPAAGKNPEANQRPLRKAPLATTRVRPGALPVFLEHEKGSERRIWRWPIKQEVFIACPVCFSGSCFQLKRTGRALSCADCGFVFTENPPPNISEPEECIFCGGSYFYFESPLDLSFLGRASICYVCEARYKGVGIDNPDESYKEDRALSARRSSAASRWKERAEQSDGQAKS
jgi:hypothetical protein